MYPFSSSFFSFLSSVFLYPSCLFRFLILLLISCFLGSFFSSSFFPFYLLGFFISFLSASFLCSFLSVLFCIPAPFVFLFLVPFSWSILYLQLFLVIYLLWFCFSIPSVFLLPSILGLPCFLSIFFFLSFFLLLRFHYFSISSPLFVVCPLSFPLSLYLTSLIGFFTSSFCFMTFLFALPPFCPTFLSLSVVFVLFF